MRMQKRQVIGWIVILVGSFMIWAFNGLVFVHAQAQNPPVPQFEPAACPDPIQAQAGFECGYLIVPEDHSDPQGKTIRLMVAIARATGPDPLPDPLIVLVGGPGSAAVGRDASSLLESTIRARRDIIYLDQRGVGLSEPNLLCSELVISVFDMTEDTDYLERLPNCRDRLVADGVNLEAYTTAQNAADVHALRTALGYEKVNLWGSSYGTRLALTIMRDYPADVRSVVLDSVFPPNADFYLEAPAIASETYRTFFGLCEDDPLCHLVYPDLQENYRELYERLNANPAQVWVTHPQTGKSMPFTFNGDDLAAGILSLLSDQSVVAMLPAFIDEFHAGDFSSMNALLHGVDGRMATNGMAFSIMCSEEAAFVTLDEMTAAAQAFPDARQVGISDNFALQACQLWLGDFVPEPRENEPVVSDIPTLLLAGELDPSTPTSWAHLAAETLESSYVYEFPGMGHIALSGSPCPQTITLDFLNNPTQVPDSGCIEDMKGIAFVVTAHATRPWSQIVAVVLGLLAVSGLGWVGWNVVQRPQRLAWITIWRLMGWLSIGFSIGGLALLTLGNFDSANLPRVVEIVIPLAIAVQMTFLFSPADDPTMELLLTYPRRAVWILLERLAVVMLSQGAIAIIFALLTLAISGDDNILLALTRWIPPTLMLTGIALYVTVRSRVAVFGAGLTLLLWFGLVMLGDMLLPGRLLQFPLNYIQPWLWPFQPYLQPESLPSSDYYLINRIVVSAAGVNLIALVARQLRDEEAILTGAVHKVRRGIF